MKHSIRLLKVSNIDKICIDIDLFPTDQALSPHICYMDNVSMSQGSLEQYQQRVVTVPILNKTKMFCCVSIPFAVFGAGIKLVHI